MNHDFPKASRAVWLSVLLRDIHFWIPLLVLIAGLLFLHELR
jgi:hypothetical protein